MEAGKRHLHSYVLTGLASWLELFGTTAKLTFFLFFGWFSK
jgi:hypothetical protein